MFGAAFEEGVAAGGPEGADLGEGFTGADGFDGGGVAEEFVDFFQCEVFRVEALKGEGKGDGEGDGEGEGEG